MNKELFEHYMNNENELPEQCHSLSGSTLEVILITKGEGGYRRVGNETTNNIGRQIVDTKNKALGVTLEQERAMVMKSMFQW